MDLGGWGMFPLELGGGPGDEEKVYRALRAMVGVGGAAENPDSVEDLWRRSKAVGLAASASWAERALWQAWPHTATDRIPDWEDRLGVVPPPGASDEDRRQLAVERYTRKTRNDGPGLAAHLAEIDARLSVLEQPHSTATTTYHGRAFEDHGAIEPFGQRKSTSFPNYSDDFVETVLFDIAAAPSPSQERIIRAARDVLNEIQPAWCAFRIITGTGFLLDTSPLDVTGFGS